MTALYVVLINTTEPLYDTVCMFVRTHSINCRLSIAKNNFNEPTSVCALLMA
jgi:hypothetical protein